MKRPSKKAIVAAAKVLHHSEGEVEIDDGAGVSAAGTTDDTGAYVAAWVWVDFEEVRDLEATACVRCGKNMLPPGRWTMAKDGIICYMCYNSAHKQSS